MSNSAVAWVEYASLPARCDLQMTELTLYHNPRCTKSRGALELLQARGLSPDVVLYLETPPDAAQLRELLGKLGISARQLLRTGEDVRAGRTPLPWEVEFVPLAYDHEQLACEMRDERLPEEFLETILTGWWTTCLEVLPSKERRRGRF